MIRTALRCDLGPLFWQSLQIILKDHGKVTVDGISLLLQYLLYKSCEDHVILSL